MTGLPAIISRWAFAVPLLVLLALLMAAPVRAIEAVSVTQDAQAIDLTNVVEVQRSSGDAIQVSTAPGADGIVRRIEVRAREAGSSPTWIVFALTNETGEQIDRLLVAPFYRLTGSGLLRPDLGASRILSITPSQGFRPERVDSADADVFQVTLDPGATVTFVAELREPRLPQFVLWEPDAYKDRINSFTLFQGIVIGIAGLATLFLIVLFMVKGGAMFPAAAGFALAALLYVAIDFGFMHRVAQITGEFDRVYRATAEASLAATLVIFLFAYLNLTRWHLRFLWIAVVWISALATIVVIAFFDPSLAAGIARISIAATAVFGFALIVVMAVQGYDRAVMLIPTWVLFILWLVAGTLTITGVLANDLAQSAFAGGLVLLVLLVGFTVAQHAFAGGQGAAGLGGDVERRALALVGAGDVIWDWDVTRDRIYTSPEAEQALGLKRGALVCPPIRWLEFLHPNDRDPFRAILEAITKAGRGRIVQDLRMKAADGWYRWYRLRARPVVGTDGSVLRCVGTLSDITDVKTVEERILHDAVHDNLTGLPSRELLIDRLNGVLARSRTDETARPSLFLIDVDGFAAVNEKVGLSVGDSILMTLARRFTRLLKPQDSIARVAGDRFALLLVSEREPERIAAFADQLRRTIRQPVSFGERDIFLTASIGLVIFDGRYRAADDMLSDAELAMHQAKRLGADRIEAFKPAMRQIGTDRLTLETELKRAIEKNEFRMLYQPVIRLEDNSVAGFEATLRWDHPRRGRLRLEEFVEIAEDSGLITDIALIAFDRAAEQLSQWQKSFPTETPLTMSVPIASRELMRQELTGDLRGVLMRRSVVPGSLKIEVAERLLVANPEHATRLLERVAELGVGLVLDQFGAAQSSLVHLRRLRIDAVKTARGVLKADGPGREPALARAIAGLARDLGVDLVADGVDGLPEAELLKSIGFTHGQGAVFGGAMAAEEATGQLYGAARLAAAQ